MPGSPRLLQDEEVTLLKPVCKNLNLPLQPPVSVVFLKKVTIKEKFTGRIIEYKPSNFNAEPVILIKRATELTSSLSSFGYIENIFSYRSHTFAIVQQFECLGHTFNGLVCISDPSICRKQIYLLESVSRPLVTAVNESSELWILNV